MTDQLEVKINWKFMFLTFKVDGSAWKLKTHVMGVLADNHSMAYNTLLTIICKQMIVSKVL